MNPATKPHLPITHTALTIALLAATTATFAANTAQIKVTGTIAPAACSASFAGGGNFNYGTISAEALSDTKANNLHEKTDTLSIACSAATKVSLKFADNVADTADGADGVADVLNTSSLFGLGKASDNSKLGAYRVDLVRDKMSVDGKSGYYMDSDDHGKRWLMRDSNECVC